jgi:hypothetical protein
MKEEKKREAKKYDKKRRQNRILSYVYIGVLHKEPE